MDPHLRSGKVVTNAGDQLQLSAGAVGFVRFADGSKLRFDGVERIEIAQAPQGGSPGGPTPQDPVPNEPAPSPPAPSNHAPGIGELSANAVFENAADGTVVGVVAATDPDAGDALTYALLDDAGGRFTIDLTSGAITSRTARCSTTRSQISTASWCRSPTSAASAPPRPTPSPCSSTTAAMTS